MQKNNSLELTKEEAMATILKELEKGRESGIEKGYYTSEEIRGLINKKGL